MGSRIAAELPEAPSEVHVWDPKPAAVLRLAAHGARAAQTPAERVSRVAAASSVLADGNAVREARRRSRRRATTSTSRP
jgi:3-hydroxyisobutyrate dehydrogenase-like beta-hydroxyacid dehydrogenase